MNISYRFIGLLLLIAMILAISICTTISNVGFNIPHDIKYLSRWVIYSSYLVTTPIFSSMVPEIVNAVIWDYRGIDTFFETSVFYIAIIAAIALFREVKIELVKEYQYLGLSKIVKTVTKTLLVIGLGAAISIALHGHITPGGGFQAGSILASLLLIVIIVFSVHFILMKGLTKNLAIIIRSIGLIGLVSAIFIPILLSLIMNTYGFVFQNQPKVMSPLGLSYVADGHVLSAMVLLLNIFEFLAIFAGFLIIFILLSRPTKELEN
ncbi:MAG: sodium:proton antiporter [Thermoprotei archaeon]|nr:MAG: sodium:proton antiporter [Thermoprotei archaeon]